MNKKKPTKIDLRDAPGRPGEPKNAFLKVTIYNNKILNKWENLMRRNFLEFKFFFRAIVI
jgi:hypothetical protein